MRKIIFFIFLSVQILNISASYSLEKITFSYIDSFLRKEIESSEKFKNFKNLLEDFFKKLHKDLNKNDLWFSGTCPSNLFDVNKKFKESFNVTSENLYFDISRKVRSNICFNSFMHSQNLLINEKDLLLIVGDLHGYSIPLADIFTEWRKRKYIDKNFQLKENIKIIFLGDYVDRGEHGLNVLTALMLLNLKNPEKIFLLRGNHEEYSIMLIYGFWDELISHFSNLAVGAFIAWNNSCELLTEILFIKHPEKENKTLQINHGGLPFDYHSEKFIDSDCKYDYIINNFFPSSRWNDIYPNLEKDYMNSPRGEGILVYNVDFVIDNYFKKNNISCLIKGHDHFAAKINYLEENYSGLLWKNRIDNKLFYNLMDNYSADLEIPIPAACNIGTKKNPIWITLACSPYGNDVAYKTTFLEVRSDSDADSGWEIQVVTCP